MPENSSKIKLSGFFKDAKVDIHIFKMSVSMKVTNISLFSHHISWNILGKCMSPNTTHSMFPFSTANHYLYHSVTSQSFFRNEIEEPFFFK